MDFLEDGWYRRLSMIASLKPFHIGCALLWNDRHCAAMRLIYNEKPEICKWVVKSCRLSDNFKPNSYIKYLISLCQNKRVLRFSAIFYKMSVLTGKFMESLDNGCYCQFSVLPRCESFSIGSGIHKNDPQWKPKRLRFSRLTCITDS